MDGFTFTKGSHDSRKSNIQTLALLTLAYTLIFTAYTCLEVFQSSINFEDGIGTVSIAVLYAVLAASSLGTGPAIVSKFTLKWALIAAWFSHTLFICANFYPVWGTMIPASVLLGFMSAVVWIAQGDYFTALTRKYSLLTHQNLRIVMGRFSAVLDQVDSISQLVGSAIAAGILHSAFHGKDINRKDVLIPDNATSFANYSTVLHYAAINYTLDGSTSSCQGLHNSSSCGSHAA